MTDKMARLMDDANDVFYITNLEAYLDESVSWKIGATLGYGTSIATGCGRVRTAFLSARSLLSRQLVRFPIGIMQNYRA